MLVSKSTTPSPMPTKPFSSPTTPPPDPPPPQRNPALAEYTTAVSHGLPSWGDHLATTGLRLSLYTPPPGTRRAPSVSSPPLVTMSCLARSALCSAPTTIGGSRPDSPSNVMPSATLRPRQGVPILWGNEPFLLAVDSSPAHDSLPTYTVGRFGAISSSHRDALQQQELRPANLRRLLCDVVLTTILLHKRHVLPILPLAGNYSPQKGGPVDKTLVNDPPPEWYHVAKWSPTPRATRWPAWDVILGLWLSGDLLLTPDVQSTVATRRRRSPYRVLYVHLKYNRIPLHTREEIELGALDVIILDGLSWHGLAPHFPDRRRLWAIHYGGEGRSLEAGLCGDEIPSWCAALHSAFLAILSAASGGPARSSRTSRWL